MGTRILFGFILMLTGTIVCADESPTTVSEPREQTLESRHLLFGSREITFAKLGDAINDILPKLLTTVKEQKISAASVIFIYHSANPTDNKPFTLDIGVLVDEQTKPVGDFKVKKLDAFKCVTVILSGKVTDIHQAYGKLIPAIAAKKLEQTGELRESYMYWESPESANNVIQLQVGVK